MKGVIISLVITAAFLSALAQLFLKKVSHKTSIRSILSLIENIHFFVAVFLFIISAVLFIYSLKFENLSILYPLFATSYIFNAFFAHFFLKEKISWNVIIGIAVIMGGVVLITY